MTVRDMVAERRREMLDDPPPARAREILTQLTSLYGNCLEAVRTTEHAYAVLLSATLAEDIPATHARIRAKASPEHLAYREALDTLQWCLEAMRSLKAAMRSAEVEMRELSR